MHADIYELEQPFQICYRGLAHLKVHSQAGKAFLTDSIRLCDQSCFEEAKTAYSLPSQITEKLEKFLAEKRLLPEQ